jgi:putative nucleotidyltransferase with HDIG domain
MANMAELAANAIGANGRLVRVGAYFHDLGKSLQPKYFIENLEPGETSPHDKLPPEVSCDAIFAHVTEGIVTARKAGLHERIIDFMHMHHGNGVLEYFWAKTREQNNPRNLSVEHFRYPGVPPQSRETAILSICDAVEAAARTLKKPEANAIDNLVQRIVYGKLHLGQLDESGLSMADLRRVAESLRDTIRHANHGRIEYPWQKAQQSASASEAPDKLTQTGPRLDSLERPARPDAVAAPTPRKSDDAFAQTDSLGATPNLKPRTSDELATVTTAPVGRKSDLALGATGRASEPAIDDETSQLIKMEADENHELATVKKPDVDEPETSLLVKMEADDSDMVAAIQRPDLRGAQTRAQSRAATDPGRSVDVELPTGPMPTDYLETRPAPKFDEDEVVELKPRIPDASDTDPRMRRVTNELAERKSSPEVAEFAKDAQHALDEAAKSLEPPVRPSSDAIPRPATASSDTSRILSTSAMDLRRAATEDPGARKRAATLPPRPATIPPPPLSRRAPTVPPFPAVTVPPSDMLRPPAKFTPSHLPGVTAPPPSAIRPPATDIVFKKDEDGDVTIEPAPKVDDAASTHPAILRDDIAEDRGANSDGDVTIDHTPSSDGAASTQPRMLRDDINPSAAQRPGRPTRERDIDAPAVMRAFDHAESASTQPSMPRATAGIGDVTSPNVELPSIPVPDAGSSWGRGLAARLERQLDEDFGRETPTSPPTRAELQALMDVAPDATKQQSVEELERLHEQARHRESQPELELTRRAPHPTREIEEDDIESAIELAPSARRTAIGIAKKKPTGE